jgi:hypothetical protein
MFPSLYRHKEDTLEIHLAVSRDGVHWTFPDRGTPFINLGKAGEFDSGSLYMGQGLVKAGDELWHYYSGSPLKHQEAELPLMTQPGNARVFSRAKIRADGYMSVDSGAEEGSFMTPLLRFAGNALALNAIVREGGSLRVALLDEAGHSLPGFDFADGEPILGDHIRCLAGWPGQAPLSALAGRPVRLAFRMTKTSLFAFQFTDSNS